MINGTFTLDPTHTTIGFIVRHAMVTKVRGQFNEFESTINGDSVSATIKTASIDTNNAERDAHVKGEDFFNVEQFPEMTFKSTSFDVDDNGNGTVTGDLTIKGITKPVTLDVETEGTAEDPFGNLRLGFEAKTKINRTDFGIDFNAPLNTGGVMLSNEIKIEIDGSAIKQA